MDVPFCVRARYQGEIKCIILKSNEINSECFTKAVISAFKIDIKHDLDPHLVLTDNLKMLILKNQFETILKTFHKGSNFFVNVELQPTNIKGAITMVTPMMIENYLITKNHGHTLLMKGAEKVGDGDLRLVSNLCVDFIIDAFGWNGITFDRKKNTAKAAIVLFPFMGFKNGKSEGTDILVGNGGLFCNRLKYLTSKRKKLLETSIIGDDIAVATNTSNMVLTNNSQEDLEFLKYSTIDDLDDATLKQKLNNTRNLRLDIMKDHQSDLREKFPFFFSHPKLLLIDFAEKHGCMIANAFLNLWPAISERLRDISKEQEKYTVVSKWPDEWNDFFILMKMVPSKPKKNPRTLNFTDLVEKLIVFRVTGTSVAEMTKSNIKTPFIVAYGLSPGEIHRYYIKVEDHLISLPDEFKVLEVFDLFIKIHDIFNLNFDDNLSNMMNFIEVLVCENKNGRKSPTAHMKQVFKQLDL